MLGSNEDMGKGKVEESEGPWVLGGADPNCSVSLWSSLIEACLESRFALGMLGAEEAAIFWPEGKNIAHMLQT